jgi:hypothetical protein
MIARQNAMAVMFISAALMSTGFAQAMEIRQFDKMADEDKGRFIATLVEGAQKVLMDNSRSEKAAQVERLFNEVLPGDKIPVGLVQLQNNIAIARVADVKRASQNPNARRLAIEDAMAVTLKKNGIELPQAFFAVANKFKPKFAPQEN